MNTQKLLSITCALLLTTITCQSAYHIARTIGAGALPFLAVKKALNTYDQYNTDYESITKQKRLPSYAQQWFEKKMSETELSIVIESRQNNHENCGWMNIGNVIAADPSVVSHIDHIEQKKDKTADDCQKQAHASIWLKHELHHAKKHDSERKIIAGLVIPMSIQAASSTSRYIFARAFSLNDPYTKKAICGRIALITMGLCAKMKLWALLEKTYWRHLEKNADEFALQHATSQEEIEEFIKTIAENEKQMLQSNDYKNLQGDPGAIWATFLLSEDPHPFPADRIAMGHEHWHQWQAKEKNDKHDNVHNA